MRIQAGTILVSVNLSQTEKASIGGVEIFTAKRYSDNWREKSPVICRVVRGSGEIIKGDYLVCSYTVFYDGSPYALSESLFAIPLNESIFARVSSGGTLTPMFGNILCERVGKEYQLAMPDDYKKNEIDRVVVAFDSGEYKKGDLVFTLKYSDYEIVFMWEGEEKRYIKVEEAEIVGVAS